MANKFYTLKDVESQLIEFFSKVEFNADTKPLLDDLISTSKRRLRSYSFEQFVQAKRTGTDPKAAKEYDRTPLVETKQAPDEEKKTVKDAQPVNEVKPIEVEQQDPTIEMAIVDLFTLGKEKVLAQFPTTKEFKSKLKELGIDSKGKIWEDHWQNLANKFNEISQ